MSPLWQNNLIFSVIKQLQNFLYRSLTIDPPFTMALAELLDPLVSENQVVEEIPKCGLCNLVFLF